MICVEKDGNMRVVAYVLQERGQLVRTDEISLSFGCANEYRNSYFIGGAEDRF
jgi:CobQ-like glutamine amidotransferase family enzyme